MLDWERYWSSGDRWRVRPRPADPLCVDERPAVSGFRYAPIRADGGVLVLAVPALGTLRIGVKEHPDDPTGRLEALGIALGS